MEPQTVWKLKLNAEERKEPNTCMSMHLTHLFFNWRQNTSSQQTPILLPSSRLLLWFSFLEESQFQTSFNSLLCMILLTNLIYSTLISPFQPNSAESSPVPLLWILLQASVFPFPWRNLALFCIWVLFSGDSLLGQWLGFIGLRCYSWFSAFLLHLNWV